MNDRSNYLNYIPVQNSNIRYDIMENGCIRLCLEHTNLFGRIASRFFNRPRISYVEFDEMGSSVWKLADGKRTVYEIGKQIQIKFGKDAEPLYERLCQYVKLLQKNGFVL